MIRPILQSLPQDLDRPVVLPAMIIPGAEVIDGPEVERVLTHDLFGQRNRERLLALGRGRLSFLEQAERERLDARPGPDDVLAPAATGG
jgi:hypothetical protein